MMTNLALLLTHKHRLISIAAILDMFDTVNGFYTSTQQPPFFNIQLVIPDSSTELLPGYERYAPVPLQQAAKADIVMIPAFQPGETAAAVAANLGLVPWIQQQYSQGAEIASFCTGAFLLGATGLLNGRPATTHVTACPAFADTFPEVLLQADKVVTVADGIYTSGGATNTFHLLLYLVEKYCGREKAIRAAKIFAIDMDRDSQAYFGIFLPEKGHSDPLVSEAQQRMEANYQQANTLESMIGDMPASRRNFVRRFKQATGITPIEYLQRTRIEAAKKLLEQTNQSILSVMLNCGYNDIKAFREVFKKGVGLTPTEYRMKFSGSSRGAALPA